MSARIVSGHRLGYSAQAITAYRAASAAAALVSENVVSADRVAQSYALLTEAEDRRGPAGSFTASLTARLPASITISGLMGHLPQLTEVQLHGDRSPRGAKGCQLGQRAASILNLSVYPPTVSAFHAWAGSWMLSVRLASA